MLWGTILAGGGGWASSPIEAGGYCTAPPTCAFALLGLMRKAVAIAPTSNAACVNLVIRRMLLTSLPTL